MPLLVFLLVIRERVRGSLTETLARDHLFVMSNLPRHPCAKHLKRGTTDGQPHTCLPALWRASVEEVRTRRRIELTMPFRQLADLLLDCREFL